MLKYFTEYISKRKLYMKLPAQLKKLSLNFSLKAKKKKSALVFIIHVYSWQGLSLALTMRSLATPGAKQEREYKERKIYNPPGRASRHPRGSTIWNSYTHFAPNIYTRATTIVWTASKTHIYNRTFTRVFFFSKKIFFFKQMACTFINSFSNYIIWHL